MEKMIRAVSLLLALLLTAGGAGALGISSANFGDVEQGRTYNQTVTLVNSQNDFDNHFTVGVDGAVKDWIKVSPSEFDLSKGTVKQITLSLKVPENASLGELTGTVTAVGKKTVPSTGGAGGSNVGYAVATKGNIYASIVKPGALASVEITGIEVQPSVQPGGIARFTVTSKNSGNVATSATFKLDIKKDGRAVVSIPGSAADFALGEEKVVKLFWDTQGAEEGKYDAYIEAATIAKGSEKTATSVYRPVPIIVGEDKSGISSILLAAAGAVILIAVSMVVLKRKK